jgi:hypothetical protein
MKQIKNLSRVFLFAIAVALMAFPASSQIGPANGVVQYQGAGGAPTPVSSGTPLPITGTISATSALNATSTLPTLSTGSQSPQGSLAGAAYVQPVFSSTSGGGTQVDATHGLPVNIVAGSSGNAAASATGSAVPADADYSGLNSSGTLVGWPGDVTDGGWVNIKSSVGIGVTGTFWQTTQPVSGTFWQTTQPVSGTFWQATQPISAASGSIASGAVASGAVASGAFAVGSIADGADVTLGTKADTAWVSGSGTEISLLKNIAGGIAGEIPAGTSLIGNVGIDQTTPGTTNGVQVNAALPAGTNLIGKAGIDQTTAGTTNGVAIVGVNAATALAGAGATGTGSQRTTVAQDTTTIAGSAPGTAQAPSANVVTVALPTSNAVSGTNSATANTSTSLITAVTSNRIYVTGYSCSNTSATTIYVSFQDGSAGTTLWTQIIPAGGGANIDGPNPLFKTTSGNAVYTAASTGETTVYCSASGYSGS